MKSDDLGMKHYVYTRSINKIPVDGAQFIVHTDKEGKVTTVNGDVHPAAEESLKGNTKAKLQRKQHFQMLGNILNLQKVIR